MSLDLIEEFALCKLTTNDLKKLLSEVSKKFTSNRLNISDYTLDKKKVSAYTYFYLPTNIPKYSFVLDQISKEIKEELKECHFIDFGSGPGTFSLAHLDYFNTNKMLSLVDSSSLMLAQAKLCISRLFPLKKNIEYVQRPDDIDLNKKDNEKSILFFGHSLNEIGNQKALRMVNEISPEFVFFIEPGTPSLFYEVLQVKEMLVTKGYTPLYPCPTGSASCPISKEMAKGQEDWCHQIFKTSHHASVERLSQIISKDRRTMPLIAHLYQKRKIENEMKWRDEDEKIQSLYITRILNETKFSFFMEICHTENSNNNLRKIEVLKKNLSKSEIKEFRSMCTGVSINFEIIKILEDGTWRGKVKTKTF